MAVWVYDKKGNKELIPATMLDTAIAEGKTVKPPVKRKQRRKVATDAKPTE